MQNKKLKPKVCKICKEKFEPKRPLQFLCENNGFSCAKEYARKQYIKNSVKATEKLHKELKKEVRSNDKKTRTRAAREACHFYITHIRDKDKECISCGTKTANDWHASHFHDSGQFSGIRYEEINIHKSCEACNTYGHGQKIGYREGIIKRYGQAYMDRMDEIKNGGRTKRWTNEELLQIENYYKEKTK